MARDSNEVLKLEAMKEVESIKTRLDRDNCPQSALTI